MLIQFGSRIESLGKAPFAFANPRHPLIAQTQKLFAAHAWKGEAATKPWDSYPQLELRQPLGITQNVQTAFFHTFS
jgi:hypothetical protein